MAENKLFLLDAYALIFRAYYALIKMPRITQSGFNTSAIFGFVNTLEELLRKEKPTHIAVCFDPPGPTFRDEAYEDYKGQREATPEDIKLSVPYIKAIIEAYNIPVVEVPGFEADDVIGTLARMAEKEGFTTYMMTPDKDYAQLVSPSIIQYKPAYRGADFEMRGEQEVCEKFGIQRTEQVIDLLALMGDKVDNIPGCPGVGEKTAAKLIAEYDNVENLIENAANIKGAIGKKIADNKEQIIFSKFLATIRTDAPVDVTPAQLEKRPADRDKLFAIFRELEFRSLIDRVGRRLNAEEAPALHAPDGQRAKPAAPANAAPSLFDFDDNGDEIIPAAEAPAPLPADFSTSDADYSLVDTPEKLAAFSTHASGKDSCAIFMVTDGENDMAASWLGTAVCFEAAHAAFIPASFAEGRGFVLDLLARADILKVCSNAKRDYVTAARFRNDDATPLANYSDISLAHYLLQSEMRHGIENLALQYLNHTTLPSPETIAPKKGNKKATLSDLQPEALVSWSCEAVDLTLRLHPILTEEVRKENLADLLNNIELPLAEVLAEMELTGVRIDVDALNDAAREMEARIDALDQEICDMAGEKFNISSPSKVGEILFDRLQLDPKAKKTKTGQYSTSEDILEKLLPKHPIVEKIMKYRALKKLYTTYLTALPAAINPATGKVHTNYNQTVTATGRISSTSPNLQNIPVRDDEGRGIRKAFISDPGNLFLSADYSQIELRLVADFASDEIMIDAFNHDKDIHAITAARIYHKEVDEVDANERRKAKTANFGILYGISAFGLASRLSIPRAEAKEIIDNYFDTFPTIRKYMANAVEEGREHGFVATRMGRKRYLPDINSKNPVVRGYAERNAINAPIQGTAADVIKLAMVNIYREMKRLNLKSKMIMQVHDELNFDVLPDELPQMQELVPRLMQAAFSGAVPLTASSGVATNWLDAH